MTTNNNKTTEIDLANNSRLLVERIKEWDQRAELNEQTLQMIIWAAAMDREIGDAIALQIADYRRELAANARS